MNEAMIRKAIPTLPQSMTIITISHNFAAISNTDDTIVIRDGHIAQQGPMAKAVQEGSLLASIFSNEVIP